MNKMKMNTEPDELKLFQKLNKNAKWSKDFKPWHPHMLTCSQRIFLQLQQVYHWLYQDHPNKRDQPKYKNK